MKCPVCNASIDAAAKFCSACGAEVVSDHSSSSKVEVVDRIDLSGRILSGTDCGVEIIEVGAEGPSENGNTRVSVRYALTNKSPDDWASIDVRLQLFDAFGRILEQERVVLDQGLPAGEKDEFIGRVWSIPSALLGVHGEKAHVVLWVEASKYERLDCGRLNIPPTPFEIRSIPSAAVGSLAHLVSGSIWRTNDDEDGRCDIEIRLSIENLSDQRVGRASLEAKIREKSGREAFDLSADEELPALGIACISSSAREKAWRFEDASVDLGVGAYSVIATGFAQRTGIQVSTHVTPLACRRAASL